jgi:AraC-like DNA-binding protein
MLDAALITATRGRSETAFSEAETWEPFRPGWRRLGGDFRRFGFSIEWHDFTADSDLNWSKSFHPGSLELCLNLSGSGEVKASRRQLNISSSEAGFYLQSGSGLRGVRWGGEHHQFVTLELSTGFLRSHFGPEQGELPPRLSNFLNGKSALDVSEPVRLSADQQRSVRSLVEPPVPSAGQRVWYYSKALELAATLLCQPAVSEEFFCQRQKRLNHERTQKVIGILKANLVNPPGLEALGRQVGCSHFYLSRTFTAETGRTISQYLRDLRMERAAKLLREGKLNVTQVAMEVGYSSPSHFSTAFHAAFGCCPGLYPVATYSQKLAAR